MPEPGENPSPSFDPRPPGDRDQADVARTPRRTSRNPRTRSVGGGNSFIGRMTGRAELDEAKARRYDPYSFESNITQLRWLVIVLIIWVAVASALAWQDRSTAAILLDLRDQGLVSVPPSQFSPDGILDYGDRENIACDSELEIKTLSYECARLMKAQRAYASEKDTGSILFVLLIVVLLATMFAFGSFTHRASRNLLTLNSKEQRFSPEKCVFWFFIPLFNLFKPWQVYRELFKGSDPDVPATDQLRWKTDGKVAVIVNVWAGIFVAVFFYNPRTIAWIWHSVRETIDDVVSAHRALMVADLLLASLGVAAIFLVIELNRRQEARHSKIGDVTVTPPRPVDPLEEALKEGIRRRELERNSRRMKGN